MTYTAFDGAKPSGASNGTNTCTEIKQNLAALRDADFFGGDIGWTYSQTGGTAEQPGDMIWSKGTERLKLTLAWGTTGGSSGNVTAANLYYSSNSGGAYDLIEARSGLSYDTDGNFTSGKTTLLLSTLQGIPGKLKALATRVTALEADPAVIDDAAASSTTAYSSTKTNATYLAKTGGTLTGNLGVKTATHTENDLAGGVAINWTTSSWHKKSTTTSPTFTFTAPPGPTKGLMLKLINTAATTVTPVWPAAVKWVGNVSPPSQAATSTAWYMFIYDGTTYWGSYLMGFPNV